VRIGWCGHNMPPSMTVRASVYTSH
jgi:hypothetical protein